MASASEQQEVAGTATPAVESNNIATAAVTSPARSDKSSDSEGKPVRDKLKETRIDAQGIPDSDHAMNDVTNGSARVGDQSASGSDSERGRLRRKRSHEDFEDEAEADKPAGKKVEVAPERHVRKRSRDISKDDLPPKPTPNKIPSIEEGDTDEQMTWPKKGKTSGVTSTATAVLETSPKTKRTRDQAESDIAATSDTSKNIPANGKPAETTEERNTKRPRDQDEVKPSIEAIEPKAKIPLGSGFANTSAASPFASMSPKPQISKTSDKLDSKPQSSDDKFKSSGFGSFSSSASSPFGGLASSKPAASSPFGATSAEKLSSFASSPAPSTTTTSGFGSLSGGNKSAFGGSSFGGSLGGSGFGGLKGGKSGLSSFGTPGTLEIKGLKAKSDTPFGAAAVGEASDDEDGDDSGSERDGNDEERRSSQPLLSQQPHETGEEGETTIWQGRAKLYAMAGDASNRAWKERGTGNFKFNITIDEPRKARFVLRADGTHRLLLNAAVTKTMVFGGNAQGEKPKDTRLLFNSPTSDGELEMHLLKLKAENAVKLWEEVTRTQEQEL